MHFTLRKLGGENVLDRKKKNTIVIKILLVADNNKIYVSNKDYQNLKKQKHFADFANREFVRRKEISHAAAYFNLFELMFD